MIASRLTLVLLFLVFAGIVGTGYMVFKIIESLNQQGLFNL